jgi:hypothetical protein
MLSFARKFPAALAGLVISALAWGSVFAGNLTAALPSATLAGVLYGGDGLPQVFDGPALFTTMAAISNCSSGASPAVCGSAISGSVAVPAGAAETLVIDTTGVTSKSQIILTIDESATISGTTCNATIATLEPPVVTARTAGTSFTIEEPVTTSTNPVCVDYFIFN